MGVVSLFLIMLSKSRGTLGIRDCQIGVPVGGKCLGNVSIESFGDISRHFKLFQDISRHFETFRDISLAGRQWPAILGVSLLADSLFFSIYGTKSEILV